MLLLYILYAPLPINVSYIIYHTWKYIFTSGSFGMIMRSYMNPQLQESLWHFCLCSSRWVWSGWSSAGRKKKRGDVTYSCAPIRLYLMTVRRSFAYLAMDAVKYYYPHLPPLRAGPNNTMITIFRCLSTNESILTWHILPINRPC